VAWPHKPLSKFTTPPLSRLETGIDHSLLSQISIPTTPFCSRWYVYPQETFAKINQLPDRLNSLLQRTLAKTPLPHQSTTFQDQDARIPYTTSQVALSNASSRAGSRLDCACCAQGPAVSARNEQSDLKHGASPHALAVLARCGASKVGLCLVKHRACRFCARRWDRYIGRILHHKSSFSTTLLLRARTRWWCWKRAVRP